MSALNLRLPALCLTGLMLAAGWTTAEGTAADPGGDHRLVKPYAGSQLRTGERRFAAYEEYPRITGRDGDTVVTEPLEGRLTRLVYNNPAGRSTLEILRNYRQALEASGLQVDFACDGRADCGTASQEWPAGGWRVGVYDDVRYFTGRLRNGDEEAYVSVAVNPRRHFVHVLEVQAMQTGMVEVGAGTLAGGLERDGHVELQGIHFETGLATLTAESRPALAQVAVLMAGQPRLRLLIVGHTDDVGDPAMNLELSRQRAQAVREALVVEHGVDPSRLETQGLGSSQPRAGNDTEQGRAGNRRVELVRQ